MQRTILLAAAALFASAAVASAQSKDEVIKPPPMKQDGSVITPPTTQIDPGIQKAEPPDQAQLPEDKSGGAPGKIVPPGQKPDKKDDGAGRNGG
jgi:hypothetical protein